MTLHGAPAGTPPGKGRRAGRRARPSLTASRDLVDTRQTTGTGLVLRFGTFEFRPARMLLLDQGKAVRLGNRALDILHILIERAGEVVTKEELIEYTWPTTVVEEGNLRVHIGALRRAL